MLMSLLGIYFTDVEPDERNTHATLPLKKSPNLIYLKKIKNK